MARAAKVGLPVTREVAMLHRQLEQKAVELVSAGREGCRAQSGSKARSQPSAWHASSLRSSILSLTLAEHARCRSYVGH